MLSHDLLRTIAACARDRQPRYNNDLAHQALLAAWRQAVQWRVAEYMIMPDHIHLFCVPGIHAPEPVRKWSRYWKRLAGNKAPALRASWQDDLFDRQFRTREQFEEKRHYVRLNPVRAGLCTSPDEWQYQGVLSAVVW